MADRPTGTVTLLFTDIEGSTRLLQRLGAADYARLLGDHHRVMRAALNSCRGIEIKTEGDSFFAIFSRAADAIVAAAQVQRGLAGQAWPAGTSVAVRIGIHTGDVGLVEGEYIGLDINRGARIAAAAHGGQVLLSAATHALVAGALPDGVTVLDLGEHRLKDLDQSEHVFQLAIEGLPAAFPPIRSLSSRYEVLPAETTTFVGRERELAHLLKLLTGTRLLTMTGPGGTGKTRLSLRLARETGADFADGVVFVPLAAITDPDLVATTIRQALGVGEESGRTAQETLVARLSGKEVLIVLDNFEQLLPAASVIAALLESTDGLKFVVTSRSVLHVTGEQEYPVPPLSLPGAAEVADLDRLAGSESVALFLQRARAARPDFELTADNASAIAAICRRLDGLPLAIELAASRIKLLPPPALLAKLGRSLDLLQTTTADRTDRQRTLRGAIGWSYDLLAEPDRRLFRRLAIFAGGFGLEDAEIVVAAAGPVGIDVFDGVAGLVDNSLIRPLGDYFDVRFGMLETILEFGREQLQATGELDVLAEAHARRVAALIVAAEPHLTAGREWADRLEANHDNVRAALVWLAEHDIDLALLSAGRLWRFWHLRGHLREGAQTLASVLAQPAAAEATPARAKALVGLAGLVYWQGNYELARRSYEEALGIARRIGDAALEVEILYGLAYVRAIERDWAGAARDFDSAQELYAQQSNELMAAWALEAGGMVATLSGDHNTAVAMLDDSLARFERLGDAFGARNTLSVETRALMHLGDLDRAVQLNRRVTRLARDSGDITSLSQSLHDAASLAALAGDHERAATLTGAAQRIVEESGGEPPPELVNRVEAMPTLERKLDRDRLDELLAAGRRMPTDEAVAYALDDSG